MINLRVINVVVSYLADAFSYFVLHFNLDIYTWRWWRSLGLKKSLTVNLCKNNLNDLEYYKVYFKLEIIKIIKLSKKVISKLKKMYKSQRGKEHRYKDYLY